MFLQREPKNLKRFRKKLAAHLKHIKTTKGLLEKASGRLQIESEWNDMDNKDEDGEEGKTGKDGEPEELHAEFEKFNPKCMICFNKFVSSDMVRTIGHADADREQCGHCFHAACIDKWLSPQISQESAQDDTVVRTPDFCPVCYVKVDPEVWA